MISKQSKLPLLMIAAFWGSLLTYYAAPKVVDTFFPTIPATQYDLERIQVQAEQGKPLFNPTSESEHLLYGGVLSHESTETPGTIYAAITVQGKHVELSRKPLNLSLVVDVSGSMDGSKMDHAKAAARVLVNALNDHDRISLVAYHHQAWVAVEADFATPQHVVNMIAGIQRLRANGGTNISEGMETGLNEVLKEKRDSYTSRIVLISDGVATDGIVDTNTLVRMASYYRESHGVGLSTVGLGVDYNEHLMQPLAQAGTGNYYFVGNASEAAIHLRAELDALQTSVASSATVELNTPSHVRIKRVYGHELAGYSGQRAVIDYGEISKGQNIDLLVELEVTHLEDGPKTDVLKVQLRHLSPSTLESHSASLMLNMAHSKARTDAKVLTRVQQVETALAVKEAMSLYERNRKNQAADLLEAQRASNSEFLKRYSMKDKAFDRVDQELKDTAKKLRVVERHSYEGKFLLKEKFHHANGAVQNSVVF